MLFPFAIIYDIVTRCRNWLYDLGWFKSHTFPAVKIISVGNLSVGGTGKTPMIQYLVRLGLEKKWSMAILSRGYGRKTKGIIEATQHTTSDDIGDECSMYVQEFGQSVPVFVSENRVEGVKAILARYPTIQLVLLDDGFQHRRLKPDFQILLTKFTRPFWKDFLVPSGLLRESRQGYRRADHMILTKCTEGAAGEIPVSIETSRTTIEYAMPKLLQGALETQVVGVSGLADNRLFFAHLSEQFSVQKVFGFKDHHDYTEVDVSEIVRVCKEKKATMLCTEKDMVKLRAFSELENISWGYIPVRVKFLSNESLLLEKIDELMQRIV